MKNLRQEFADTMLEVGQVDDRLVVMVGDISHGVLQDFAKHCPGRYFNIGICEPTIVNMAAGVAKSGLIPVVHTIAPFIIERAYEQIKLDFGYQNFSGNFISVGSAFDYAQLGCSHHCYTDLSILAHFKRAQLFFPGSCLELNKLFKQNYDKPYINYFRLPNISHDVEFLDSEIETGKAIVARTGKDMTIVVIGPLLKTALEAADLFLELGIEVEVIYAHTIKPFDQKTVKDSVEKTKHVITLEEASAHDGLFNLVLKATIDLSGVLYIQMAIEDFIHGYGSYAELCQKVGFTPQKIMQLAKEKFSDLF